MRDTRLDGGAVLLGLGAWRRRNRVNLGRVGRESTQNRHGHIWHELGMSAREGETADPPDGRADNHVRFQACKPRHGHGCINTVIPLFARTFDTALLLFLCLFESANAIHMHGTIAARGSHVRGVHSQLSDAVARWQLESAVRLKKAT